MTEAEPQQKQQQNPNCLFRSGLSGVALKMLGVRACDQAEAFEHRTEQPVSCRFGKPAEHSTAG